MTAENASNPTNRTADARDLDAELAEPEAGEHGLPVDARCVNCRRVRAKLVPDRDPDDRSSFKHVCHQCQRATWWNVLRVLDDQVVGE